MLLSRMTDPLRRSIRHLDPHGGKARLEGPPGPAPPAQGVPGCRGQRLFCRERGYVGHGIFPRAAAPRHGEGQGDVGGIDLLARPDAHRPGEATRTQSLPVRGAQALAGVSQHAAEAHPRLPDAVNLLQSDLGLGLVGLLPVRHESRKPDQRVPHPALLHRMLHGGARGEGVEHAHRGLVPVAARDLGANLAHVEREAPVMVRRAPAHGALSVVAHVVEEHVEIGQQRLPACGGGNGARIRAAALNAARDSPAAWR